MWAWALQVYEDHNYLPCEGEILGLTLGFSCMLHAEQHSVALSVRICFPRTLSTSVLIYWLLTQLGVTLNLIKNPPIPSVMQPVPELLFTNRLSMGGDAITSGCLSIRPSVHSYVRFHSVIWTNWPVTLTFCMCIGHDHSFPEIEGHSSRSTLSLNPNPNSQL